MYKTFKFIEHVYVHVFVQKWLVLLSTYMYLWLYRSGWCYWPRICTCVCTEVVGVIEHVYVHVFVQKWLVLSNAFLRVLSY